MTDAVAVVSERRVRRWRSISEKRQIVQLTLKPGASVAEVARAHGVNANQVFKWRRAFERGELSESCAALIPVTISSGSDSPSDADEVPQTSSGGAITTTIAHISHWISELRQVVYSPRTAVDIAGFYLNLNSAACITATT